VPGNAPPLGEPLAGIGGAPVGLLPAGSLGVWISHVAHAGARAEDLRAHHRVVQAICDTGPALPVRFSVPSLDEASLVAALAPRTDALLAALKRVGSKRELAITLTWREPVAAGDSQSAESAGPGRTFMLERAKHWSALEARRTRATEIETELTATLREGAVQEAGVKVRIVPAPRVALSCAVLIEPAEAAEVMRRVRDRSAEWPDVQLHVAGPWPAYSFSDGE
jgi:hypothetical protein